MGTLRLTQDVLSPLEGANPLAPPEIQCYDCHELADAKDCSRYIGSIFRRRADSYTVAPHFCKSPRCRSRMGT